MIDIKALKQKILQLAIQGNLVPQNPDDEPASVLLERIRAEKQRLFKEGKIKKDKSDSVIFKGDDNRHYEKIGNNPPVCIEDELPFEIPDSWTWIRLGTLFQHNTGKALNAADTKGTKQKYITTSNLYWGYFVIENLREMLFTDDEIDKCTARYGDLLVCEGGDIGRAAIWTLDQPICIQNHIHRLRPYFPVTIKYFYYVFYVYKSIGFIGGKGIGIQGLSSQAINKLIISLPPLAEQEQIVKHVDELFAHIDTIDNNQAELKKLYNDLKKRVLDLAIQGKLVPQEPTDEPASVLLEKIRAEKKAKLGKKYVDSFIYKGDDNCYYEKVGGNAPVLLENLPFDIPESWCWVRLGTLFQHTRAKR